MIEVTDYEAMWSLNPFSTHNQDCLQGFLSSGNDGIILNFRSGGLIERSWNTHGKSGSRAYSPFFFEERVLYGLSNDNMYLQFYAVNAAGNYQLSLISGVTSINDQKVEGGYLIVSNELLSCHFSVKEVNFTFCGLDNWIHVDRAARLVSTEDSPSGDFEILIFSDDEIKVSIRTREEEAGYNLSDSGIHGNRHTYVRVSLINDAKPLDDILDTYVYPLHSFICFCMASHPAIEYLDFKTAEEQAGRFYARFNGVKKKANDGSQSFIPFTYESFDDIQLSIRNWFDLKKNYYECMNIIISLMDKFDMPQDMIFLASAQALEGISRSFSENKIMPKSEFKKLRAEIEECNLCKDTKDLILKKIDNRKSANDMLKEMLMCIESYTDYIVPNKDKFIKDHRRLRDSYTHRISEDNNRLGHECLYAQTEAVKLLAYGAIAFKLDIPIAKVIERMDRYNSSYSKLMHIHRYYSSNS